LKNEIRALIKKNQSFNKKRNQSFIEEEIRALLKKKSELY